MGCWPIRSGFDSTGRAVRAQQDRCADFFASLSPSTTLNQENAALRRVLLGQGRAA